MKNGVTHQLDWEIDDEGFQLVVEIPANTSAVITLPHAVLERYLPELTNFAWLSQLIGFSIDTAMQTLPDKYIITTTELQDLKSELFER